MQITGGILKSRKIIVPKSNKVRPTLSKTRMCIFNMLYSYFGNFDNKWFLDFFCGSGIMALEAFSRGFSVVAVEKDFYISKIIKENIAYLNANINLITKNALGVKFDNKFDVIFIDPPYIETSLYELTLEKIKFENLLSENGVIIVETVNNNLLNYYKIIREKQCSSSKIYMVGINK